MFFDTVFYLLIPLARALRVRTGKNYLLYVMAICAGGTVTHSLVPPTPGPVAVASELGLDLGIVILMGLSIGLPASFAGWLYGVYMDRKLNIELREAPGLSMEELKTLAFKPDHELPGFVVSMLPIALPFSSLPPRPLSMRLARGADWQRSPGSWAIRVSPSSSPPQRPSPFWRGRSAIRWPSWPGPWRRD